MDAPEGSRRIVLTQRCFHFKAKGFLHSRLLWWHHLAFGLLSVAIIYIIAINLEFGIWELKGNVAINLDTVTKNWILSLIPFV